MANEALYDEALDIAPDNEYDETSDGYEDEQPHTHAEPDWQEPAGEHPEAEEPLNLDPLDQLPMALTLRCGSLNLTLGDLRRIAAGSVLEVSGVTPGYATLCHGDRVVAEGELVDVEGRLGLQITRMATPA
ncbi:FliM/FliN family flagellar motor switch protein [Pseudomonas abietaniphila]|jgi:type III secretion protein Q